MHLTSPFPWLCLSRGLGQLNRERPGETERGDQEGALPQSRHSFSPSHCSSCPSQAPSAGLYKHFFPSRIQGLSPYVNEKLGTSIIDKKERIEDSGENCMWTVVDIILLGQRTFSFLWTLYCTDIFVFETLPTLLTRTSGGRFLIFFFFKSK